MDEQIKPEIQTASGNDMNEFCLCIEDYCRVKNISVGKLYLMINLLNNRLKEDFGLSDLEITHLENGTN